MSLVMYMFDTNVFNRILDGVIPIQAMRGHVVACATHIQRDEIDNTKNSDRRAALARIFRNVVTESLSTASAVVGVSRVGGSRVGGGRVVPTESMVWGISRWGEAKWSADDALYGALKRSLDTANRSKPNNIHDALIAETSIKGGHVLVTDDSDLSVATKHYGGDCISVAELLARCSEGAAT